MTTRKVQASAYDAALGLSQDLVELRTYDDRWPALFESEAALLRAGLGGQISCIAHIGSTAIIGMPSKPVMDMMIAIPTLRASSLLFWSLQRYGYELQAGDALNDRLFFVKESRGKPTHHLSACEQTSEYWVSHLAFRDRLRADPQLARRYLELKQSLCARHPTNRAAYTAGKEAFIVRVLRGDAVGDHEAQP